MELRFFVNGDTTFGIWIYGFHFDLRDFSGKYVINAEPNKMNLLVQGNLNEFCEPLYYHNLKNVAEMFT